jgi:hypothetical protein
MQRLRFHERRAARFYKNRDVPYGHQRCPLPACGQTHTWSSHDAMLACPEDAAHENPRELLPAE